MGADMTGYILVGPREIDSADKERAARRLLELGRADESSGQWSCPDCGSENSSEDLGCTKCGIAAPLRVETLKAARLYIKELCEDWPPDHRDVMSRQDPRDDNRVIVAAGDMTWGDEPSGDGYQALKRIMASGVAEELGIE